MGRDFSFGLECIISMVQRISTQVQALVDISLAPDSEVYPILRGEFVILRGPSGAPASPRAERMRAVRCPAEQEEARRHFSTYSAALTSLRQARCRSSAGSVLAQPRRGRSRLDTRGHAVPGQERSHRASRG